MGGRCAGTGAHAQTRGCRAAYNGKLLSCHLSPCPSRPFSPAPAPQVEPLPACACTCTCLSQAEREVADGDGVTVLNNQITCRIL